MWRDKDENLVVAVWIDGDCFPRSRLFALASAEYGTGRPV